MLDEHRSLEMVFGQGGELVKLLRFQEDPGSFPSGRNGPYGHEETAVRNTAHILFGMVYAAYVRQTVSKALVDSSIERAIAFLCSRQARPSDFSFSCRLSGGGDQSNGLVGQAWVIEALSFVGKTLGREELLGLAREVADVHPWSNTWQCWHVVNPDGEVRDIDRTFNHQLWFAAALSTLEHSEHEVRVTRFINRHLVGVQKYRDGVIQHRTPTKILGAEIARLRFNQFKEAGADAAAAIAKRKKLRIKSVGYHSFNLLALTILRRNLGDMDYWISPEFTDLLRPIEDADFIQQLELSSYGYGYNLSGFELAIAAKEFGLGASLTREWLARQHAVTPLSEISTSPVISDLQTFRARLYELAYLDPRVGR